MNSSAPRPTWSRSMTTSPEHPLPNTASKREYNLLHRILPTLFSQPSTQGSPPKIPTVPQATVANPTEITARRPASSSMARQRQRLLRAQSAPATPRETARMSVAHSLAQILASSNRNDSTTSLESIEETETSDESESANTSGTDESVKESIEPAGLREPRSRSQIIDSAERSQSAG